MKAANARPPEARPEPVDGMPNSVGAWSPSVGVVSHSTEASSPSTDAPSRSTRIRANRPRVVIIGPTPPPFHGMSVFTRQLLDSPVLAEAYELIHLDTADRRESDNMGRFELGNVVLGLRHGSRLAWLMVRHRPEIVYVEISQNTWAYLRDTIFIVLGRLLGGRVVTHLHGSDLRAFYERSNAAMRWLIRRTSRMLEAAAVLGEDLRGIYDGLVVPERIHSVPNGVPDPFPDGLPRRDRGSPVTVAYLGTLTRRKGVHDLLAAAARLEPPAEAVRWTFAGEWRSNAEREEAERIIEANGLESSVEFVGRVDSESKRRFLAEADLLVFPSAQAEGMPLVILEAMAAGLPIVSTETGVVRDMVVEGRTGRVVPRGDVAALAGAIGELVGDADLRERMGDEGRRLYEAEFTDDACARRMVRLFDDVIERVRGAS